MDRAADATASVESPTLAPRPARNLLRDMLVGSTPANLARGAGSPGGITKRRPANGCRASIWVPMPSPTSCIGLIGTFDVENYGDVLLARITRRELESRLPGTVIRVLAPVGYVGLNRFDDGSEIESLGPWSFERVTELAEGIDLAVIGGGEIILDHDELLAPHYGLEPAEMHLRAPSRFFIEGLGPDVALAWHCVGVPQDIDREQYARYRDSLSGAYVTVRDETSRQRLRAAAKDVDVKLVPDSGFLVDRLFSEELLARRAGYLRTIAALPPDGVAPVVVQGNRDLVPFAAEIAGQISLVAEGAPVVCVETGPCHGDDEFAEAFSASYHERVWIPGTYAGISDITSIISTSRGFVGSSFHGNIAAFVFGKPSVILAMDRRSKLSGLGAMMGQPQRVAGSAEQVAQAFRAATTEEEILRSFQKRLDGHFDHLAEIAIEAAWRRNRGAVVRVGVDVADPIEGEIDQLRTALEVRGRRSVDERLHLSDEMQALRAEVGVQGDRIEELQGQLAGVCGELEDLRGTAIFRYTKGLRAVYSAVFMPIRIRMQSRRRK